MESKKELGSHLVTINWSGQATPVQVAGEVFEVTTTRTYARLPDGKEVEIVHTLTGYQVENELNGRIPGEVDRYKNLTGIGRHFVVVTTDHALMSRMIWEAKDGRRWIEDDRGVWSEVTRQGDRYYLKDVWLVLNS